MDGRLAGQETPLVPSSRIGGNCADDRLVVAGSSPSLTGLAGGHAYRTNHAKLRSLLALVKGTHHQGGMFYAVSAVSLLLSGRRAALTHTGGTYAIS